MLPTRARMHIPCLSGAPCDNGASEKISTFRFINYETLSYLPQVSLNQTYESYITQHISNPLTRLHSHTTPSKRKTVAGHQRDVRDDTHRINGGLVLTVPY